MRPFPLHLAVIVALVGSLVASVAGERALSAPSEGPGAVPGSAQEAAGIYPPSILVQGERFLLDRLVPLDRADFQRVEDQDDIAFYASTDAPPFETLYGLRSGRSASGLARYLPTNIDDPETACRAEAAQVGPLTGAEVPYAFAGIETDLTPDDLEQIAEAAGQPVYADPGAGQPSPELFVAGDAGLLRFLITDGALPTALPTDVPFGEAVYAFDADATDQVDAASLTKVGCVGPFPAFAAAPADGAPADQIYVLAGQRYLSFLATGETPSDDVTTDVADEEAAPDDGIAADATPGQDEEPAITQTDDEGADGEATPPVDEATDEEDTDEEGSAGLSLELAEDIGNGGQPEDLPREIVLDGSRYLFDRTVPLRRQDLTRVAQTGPVIAYAIGEDGPFDAVFISIPNRSEDELARYLPERLETPDVDCAAQAVGVGNLQTGDATYAFAGIETTLTPDTLEQIGDSNGQPVYTDPGAAQPSPELFVGDPNGLLRFVLLGADGRAAAFADTLAFAGGEFTFVAEVTGQVDAATQAKAGCAGPFPVYTDPAQAGGPFLDLYVAVGDRLFQFAGESAPVDESTPIATPDVATETPVPVDTETPVPDTETPVPTEIPTETPLPPTETPVPPTDTPVPPTDTPVPPTETPVPDTETPVPTETAVPPTETPVPPTETPVPTEMPTETPVPPTETVAAAEVPTEVPTEAPATAAPTEVPATEVPATEAPATEAPDATQIPLTAEEANLPAQVEVQNTTYVFNQVSVDIDIQTLVQVEVIVVQNVEVTVYARETVQGVAPELYCVTAGGQVIGRYVPAASAQPTPPPSLPPTVEVEDATYVFNEVDIDIDITTLVQVQVVVIQNVEVTIYADQEDDDQPTRLYVVTPGGDVVGQYVVSTLVVTLQPQPTAQPTRVVFEPPAVVPTLAPNVPSPAAVTAVATLGCSGDIGEPDARGVPSYLPNRVQIGGVAYGFVRGEAVGDVGKLTRITCIGPFEAAATDQADRAQVIYLRSTERDAVQVFRFEAVLTFRVDIEVTGQTRTVNAADRPYQLLQTWQPWIYGSLSILLFIDDLENASPETIYAVDVHDSVVGELVAEYRLAEGDEQPTEAIATALGGTDFNPDLILNGQRYVVVAIFYPVGTTTNGFLTLFSSDPDGDSDILIGRDKRETELFVFRGNQPTGG